MSNTIGYDLEGFANSSVSVTNITSTQSSLYLPFDDDINDDSDSSVTVTASGDAAISSTQVKYGSNSLALDGNGDYLSLPAGTFPTGSGVAWTIEGWAYHNTGTDQEIMGDGNSGRTLIIFRRDGTVLYVAGRNSSNQEFEIYPAGSLPSTDAWYHWAVVFDGSGTLSAYADGSRVGTASIGVGGLKTATNPVLIGARTTSSTFMNGYQDDIRIIPGLALYSGASYTVPTSAGGKSHDVSSAGYSDTKFLSSVWGPDDVSEKMADGTWIRNDVTSGANPAGVVVQGAGLEVSGHRWYVAPPVITGVEILAVGAGGSGSHSNPPGAPGIQGVSGGNTVFTQTSTSTFILAQGGGAASLSGGGVGGAGGGAGGFVTASDLELQKDVGYTVVIGANGATPHGPLPAGPSAPLDLTDTGAPGGSGGGGTFYDTPGGASVGTGNQPTIAQPFISGISGASGFQNLGFPGTGNPSNTDNAGADNGPARGGGAGGSGPSAATGATSSITGTSVSYAGGGYAGTRGTPSPYLANPGPGGDGVDSGNGGAGVRGGGGGGGSGNGQGGLGGPGMLIIAYPDAESDLTITGSLSYTQPTRSGYKVYEFTSGSGTISLDS